MRALDTRRLPPEDLDATNGATPYAILSHTWGSDEVFLYDVRHLGYGKLSIRVHKAGTDKVL